MESKKAAPAPSPEHQQHFGIRVRCHHVEDNKDGTQTIFVPARDPSKEERQVLRSLFRNTLDQAYNLLAKEALFEAMVEE